MYKSGVHWYVTVTLTLLLYGELVVFQATVTSLGVRLRPTAIGRMALL